MNASPRLQQRAYKCSQALIRTHRQLVACLLLQDLDSPNHQTFINSLHVCETRLVESMENGRYTLAIACAQLLATVVQISLAQSASKDTMDVDQDITASVVHLGTNVIHHISRLDLMEINKTVFLNKKAQWQLYEFLKVKATLCLLLADYNCEASFRETFHVMAVANDKMSSILLPFLSSISCQCSHLSQWLPNTIIDVLKLHYEHPTVFVNLVRLLFRTTHSLSEKDEISASIVQLLRTFGDWNEHTRVYTRNAWYLYLIGREAGCYGWYQVMHYAFQDLTRKVNTDRYRMHPSYM
ncbi:hypothetical protein BDF14DRAFT_1721343 [Spinellus fusiger]|nr:hypothetical protein BDF14DRAFT_1721343 [Spinellus fusiger]